MINQNIDIELSIVMPCLNEALTIADCINTAFEFIKENGINGEVIIADNGSSDGSIEIIEASQAKLVSVIDKGYGSALMGGIAQARGKYVIMADTDGSHDLNNLSPFLEKLREGFDLVVGNRFKGGISRSAMPFLNKYFGNPILTAIGKLLFRSKLNDFHCGLRGINRQSYDKLNTKMKEFEFTSEVIIKSELYGYKICEVPTRMLPSGRNRPAHLRPFRDGWRTLRFLLLFSPRWLFLYPGFAMVILGTSSLIMLMLNIIPLFDFHSMLYSALLIIAGAQSISFAILTKTYAVHEGLLPEHSKLNKFMRFATLENGLLIGLILLVLGVTATLYALALLNSGKFTLENVRTTMRIVIPAVTFLATGFQIVFFSFFYSMLKMRTN